VTLNIRQVDFSITQRNKGLTQEVSAATTGISVRSGRRVEKGLWRQAGGQVRRLSVLYCAPAASPAGVSYE
jgi:hypothetical protein